MTSITNNPVAGTSSSSNSSSNSSSSGNVASALGTQLSQKDFLQLMTAQLQAQDPTNPVNNNEFVQEMAQFSTLSETQQIDTDINTYGGELTSGIQNTQVLNAGGMVGHKVLVDATSLTYAGSPITGAVNVATPGDVQVDITDTNGNTIQKIDLGQQEAGVVPFTWNGVDSSGAAVSQGSYNIAATSGGAAQTTLIEGTVTAAGYGGASTGTYLQVAGMGDVPLSEIAQLQ